ncbi:MAG TPA: hypothetical protein VF075_02700 [Pyrinomonadaceae bacterium]
MEGQENDPDLRIALLDPVSDFYSAHVWHRDIKDTDVGLQSSDGLEETRPITHGCQYFKPPFQQTNNRVPYFFVIIRY